MSRPSQSEIDKEIEELRALTFLVRPMTFFNESNIEAIEAQIRVLENDMSEDDVSEEFGDDESTYVMDAAVCAAQWLRGDATEELAESWKSLVIPGGNGRKLVTSDQAVKAKCQHKTPCSDCPWRRESLRGWLGGASKEEWISSVKSDARIECHTLLGAECAGAAIFRANICKLVADPNRLVLPRDSDRVFSTDQEFLEHHTFPEVKGST